MEAGAYNYTGGTGEDDILRCPVLLHSTFVCSNGLWNETVRLRSIFICRVDGYSMDACSVVTSLKELIRVMHLDSTHVTSNGAVVLQAF